MQADVTDIDAQLKELDEQKTELSEKITEQETIYTDKEKHLTEMKAEVAQTDDTSMDLTRELVKMREEYNEKHSEIHELKLKRDRLSENLQALTLQLSELDNTKSTYAFELKDIDWQKEEFSKESKQQQKQIKDLEKTLFTKKKQEAELTEQLSDLDNAIRKLQREQSQLQAKSDALQSIHGAYNQTVNAVLAARDSGELHGVHGTIAELANVEKKFETPVEIAAGPRMQSIVVSDDEAAAQAINFLRKKKLGRATFLPLNKMIVGKPRGKALMTVNDPASHGFAFDLVKYKKEYEGAFWYVFGDTIIVDNLSEARRLMGGVRLVDMQGDLIEASGAMIGGSKPILSLSFGTSDTSKLEEVTQKLREAIDAQDRLSADLAVLRREITDLEATHTTQKTVTDATGQRKDLDVRHKEYTGKLELIEKELAEKIKEKETIDKELGDTTTAIETGEKRLAELDSLKEEKGKHLLKTTNKKLAQEIRSLEDEVGKLQEQLLTLRSEVDTLAKKYELINERKTEQKQKITTAEQEIETYRSTIKELKQTRSTLQNELKTLMNVEEQMTGKIKNLAGKRDTIYKKTVTIENDLDKLNTRIESYHDLISRAKYRLPTLEDTIKELNQEIELYHVELTDKQLPNIEALKETIRGIEATMQELEPVNMRALEEYEHQSERKKKFDADVDHLKEQKKNLMKLVTSITAKKKERFLEVFEEINKNFQRIYAQLSEGGEASLQLENEENIFESGLTIRARPRGKKVLLLSALSGGEKSIASLGFIFAIQQYDPSPFYVLDEVDMFLDGINAETVSRMIKNNALHSQFITVSLRKILLTEANHVYGVTMHESGISEMIGNIDPGTVGPKGEIKTTKTMEPSAEEAEVYYGRAA
jgi:chromosome segregation protein